MPALFVPLDGRTTSQNVLLGPLDPTAVLDIVSPGNATAGNSFQVSLATLATFFGSFINPTIIKTGTSYASVGTDTRILLELGAASAFTITLLASSSYTQPILVKDVFGTVSESDELTILFSGGQTADGQTSVVLRDAYAGIWLNPLTAGNWYLTAA
jgi:hypothetical protein